MPLGLPEEFVLYDTEFTSWDGARERCWLGLEEHRELIQIAGLKVKDLDAGEEFSAFVKPKINSELSKYIMDFTGISQEDVDEKGRALQDVMREFSAWVGNLNMYSYGPDGRVIAESCWLHAVDNPFPFSQVEDIREMLDEKGVDYAKYTSGTLPKAFGVEPGLRAHDALNDVKNMLEGLKLLAEREKDG